MIAVKDLRKSIRNGPRTVDILKGLDFTVPKGQFAAIMGSLWLKEGFGWRRVAGAASVVAGIAALKLG